MEGPLWYVTVYGFVISTWVNEATARYYYDLRVRVFGEENVKIFKF